MAIRNPQPQIINGVSYDLLSVDLSLSTKEWQGRMVLTITASFQAYRDGENGPEVLSGVDPPIPPLIIWDAMAQAQDNPRLAQFLVSLEQAAQAYIDGGR
jgi:hypothetical protein